MTRDKREAGWNPLWTLLRNVRLRVAALSMVSFGGAMAEAGMLVLLTHTVMRIAEGQDTLDYLGRSFPVMTMIGVVAALLIIRLVLALIGVRLSAGLTTRILNDLRFRVAQAYLRASWAMQQTQPSGRLQEILTTFVNQSIQAVTTFTHWVTAWLSLAAFLVTAVVVDPVATGLVLVALAVLGALLGPLRRRIRRVGAVNARTGLAFTNSVAELGSLGLEMQVFGVQGRFAERIRALSRENARARYTAQIYSGALAPTYMSLAYAAVVAGIAVLAAQGTSNLAAVGAVLLLMLRSLAYGQQVQTTSGSIAEALAYVTRMQGTIAEYEDAAASGGGEQPESATPVELARVRFGYTPEQDALVDVSLRIESNEIVGVIGPSGSGKSTLVQLLLGLRDPSDGVVRAGGVDLREVDREWWAERVAMVAQDALLFTGTVAENIRFFREGITDDDLRRAAKQANILADIQALPSGFDTHLGERGSQLSGGQRQRVSIARALAGKPELLILDEPTSALDVRSEALIRDTLTELHGRTTVVIIAHRMSTLDICNRIAVIEGGRVTAFDAPAALLGSSDFYRNALSMSGMLQKPPEPDSDS